jgi:hypothetical protein
MFIYPFSKLDFAEHFYEVLMSPLSLLEARRVPGPTSYYLCDTERRSHLSLQVGMDGIIRLWEPGTTIRIFVSTKCSISRLGTTQRALQRAIDVWNVNLTGGPSFCQVFEKKEATCQVKIRGGTAAHSCGPKKGETLARAFFPGDHHPTIELFRAAFTEANVVFLPKVFAHELIHVLGVRHYFAQKGDRGKFLQQPVEVGQRNEKSISNYFTFLGELQIQKSDVEALGILYAQKHTTIHGLPVSYHHAVPLSWWKDVESDP